VTHTQIDRLHKVNGALLISSLQNISNSVLVQNVMLECLHNPFTRSAKTCKAFLHLIDDPHLQCHLVYQTEH
jgi:hypothetical protein